MKKLFNCTLLIIFIAALAGCRESDERRHPLYIKALQAQQDGKGQDAADKLCELLKRRPRSTHVHKLLASIYDEMLNDPAAAVYHYKAYLQAAPAAADAEEVTAWMIQSEKRCYQILHERFSKETILPQTAEPEKPAVETAAVPTSESVPPPRDTASNEKSPSAESNDTAGQAEIIAAKDKEIAELKQKMAQYQARYNTMRQEVEKVRKQRNKPQPQPVAEIPPVNGQYRQYKVVAGDTPGSIARKVYGKSSLHYVIMRANPQIDAKKLRPGMILNIPQTKENREQDNTR